VILISGATGFIGRSLVTRLAQDGKDVRCLIRPSRRSPRLPRGVPVEVAMAHLDDLRGLRAAMADVECVFHLAGAEWRGGQSELMQVDVAGTRAMVEAAREARVSRLVYLSHLGADRGSAYPVHKAKGIAEEFVKASGLPYTIFRSAIVFGREDVFTNAIAMVLNALPFVFPMPGDGRVLLQPLWVEDLTTCMAWSLEDRGYLNQTISLGGPEAHSFLDLVRMIMTRIGVRRFPLSVRAPYLRAVAWWLEGILPRSPLTPRWLDYLAVSRTGELISVTRHFGLKPARFEPTLGHLEQRRWRRELLRFIFGRQP